MLDLCHIEVSGAEWQVSMQPGANWVPIFASIGTCQRAPDCQRLSAAMALTACPAHSPFSESNRPACRGLDMRKVPEVRDLPNGSYACRIQVNVSGVSAL